MSQNFQITTQDFGKHFNQVCRPDKEDLHCCAVFGWLSNLHKNDTTRGKCCSTSKTKMMLTNINHYSLNRHDITTDNKCLSSSVTCHAGDKLEINATRVHALRVAGRH